MKPDVISAFPIRLSSTNHILFGTFVWLASCVFPTWGEAGVIYWAESNVGGRIGTAEITAGVPFTAQTLVTGSGIVGLDVDTANGKIYWAENNNSVRRINLDGSGITENVVTGGSSIHGVAVSATDGHVYYSDNVADSIRRADISPAGSLPNLNIEIIANTGTVPTGVELDVLGGKVYWSDVGTNQILRRNLDGTGTVESFSASSFPAAFTLDLENRYVYWGATNLILRADLDGVFGGNVTTIVNSGVGGPAGIDIFEGKVYWSDDFGTSNGTILRADIGGLNLNVETVLSGLINPRHIVIVTPVPEPSTFVIMGLGMIGLAGYGWRRRVARTVP